MHKASKILHKENVFFPDPKGIVSLYIGSYVSHRVRENKKERKQGREKVDEPQCNCNK